MPGPLTHTPVSVAAIVAVVEWTNAPAEEDFRVADDLRGFAISIDEFALLSDGRAIPLRENLGFGSRFPRPVSLAGLREIYDRDDFLEQVEMVLTVGGGITEEPSRPWREYARALLERDVVVTGEISSAPSSVILSPATRRALAFDV